MPIDLNRARSFLATHGRVLDRRRLEVVVTGETAARRAVVDGLAAYRNADGGYGYGLEPDLRAPESQPQGAQHALEALIDAAPVTSPDLVGLLDWLDATTLPDGGLPFTLPVAGDAGCAPFFLDPVEESSLQATSVVAAHAHQLGRTDRRVHDHPWLGRATDYCLAAIEQLDQTPAAHALAFSLRFLDNAGQTRPEAADLLDRLARELPADGAIPVAGGKEGESLRVLSYSPEPGRPLRALLDHAAVEHDLELTAQAQENDGGWPIDFETHSPAAALEWRGYATVAAVTALRLNNRER